MEPLLGNMHAAFGLLSWTVRWLCVNPHRHCWHIKEEGGGGAVGVTSHLNVLMVGGGMGIY